MLGPGDSCLCVRSSPITHSQTVQHSCTIKQALWLRGRTWCDFLGNPLHMLEMPLCMWCLVHAMLTSVHPDCTAYTGHSISLAQVQA
eukprot:3971-Heterococcus_DN1.PRE.2